MKLCVVYNFAQHYRTSIFELIDQTFETSWFFGKTMADVKKMDYSCLHGQVTEVDTKRFAGWSFQRGVPNLIRKDFDTYILLGETKCLSTWLFCIRARLFHHKKRVYYWTHGWYGKETFFERLLKDIFFRLPNGGCFLYGNYAKQLMISRGFDSRKLFVIHNSLAYDRQIEIRNKLSSNPFYKNHFENDNRNLLFVGRLTSVKKLDMILQALVILRNCGHFYNVTFIGEGVEKEYLIDLTNTLGLNDSIWFYGSCYDEVVLGEMIYNADLCVSPGNVGLTAIHSMVFGTPVLTHDCFPYQMPEFEAIHEGTTGLFFKYNDVSSLADSIIRWFSFKGDKREEVRKDCIKEISEFWTPKYQLSIFEQQLIK